MRTRAADIRARFRECSPGRLPPAPPGKELGFFLSFRFHGNMNNSPIRPSCADCRARISRSPRLFRDADLCSFRHRNDDGKERETERERESEREAGGVEGVGPRFARGKTLELPSRRSRFSLREMRERARDSRATRVQPVSERAAEMRIVAATVRERQGSNAARR